MPEIRDVQIVPVNDVRIRYTTEQGYHYRLQRSSDLRTSTTVCWGIPGTGLEQEVVVPGGMIPKTYYRIVAGW
jgi:hypothetical protein